MVVEGRLFFSPRKRAGPAAVGFDDLVDLGHQADGFAEGDDDLVVVGDCGHSRLLASEILSVREIHTYLIYNYQSRSLPRHHRVIKSVVRKTLMAFKTRIAQRSILVTPEGEHRLIHLFGIENLQPDKQVEILHR